MRRRIKHDLGLPEDHLRRTLGSSFLDGLPEDHVRKSLGTSFLDMDTFDKVKKQEEEKKKLQLEKEEEKNKLQTQLDPDIYMEEQEASVTSMDDGNDDIDQLEFSPEKQRQIIDKLMNDYTMKKGDTHYALSKRWYETWRQYTGHNMDEQCTDSERQSPEKIDNYDLIDGYPIGSSFIQRRRDQEMNRQDHEIDFFVKEARDYIFVPKRVWEMVHKWYTGGPALPRSVTVDSNGTLFVDPKPIHIQAFTSPNESFPIKISKMALVRELYEIACTHLSLEQSKVKIWKLLFGAKNTILDIFAKTLGAFFLMGNNEIYVENLDDKVSQPESPWSSSIYSKGFGHNFYRWTMPQPTAVFDDDDEVSQPESPCSSSIYSKGFSHNFYQWTLPQPTAVLDDEDGTSWPNKQGESRRLQGLKNLGNTCFMNSAIQCLVQTSPLAEYFRQDFDADINKTNPLGNSGELAIRFSVLLKRLWSSEGALTPSAFKRKLDVFAPQFSGSYQHDSHEFLAFLLDGLHEDLNRVKDKPFIERKDSDDRLDKEVATEYWENYKARNDSVIVDVFQGQDKSTLACPVCGKVSVTFDPFMYLSVPLPKSVKREMTVTVFHCDGSASPTKYTLEVPRNGCCKDLIESMSTTCCLSSDETLYLAEVCEHKIKRYVNDTSEKLSSINDNDVIVTYRIPTLQESSMKLEIIHTITRKPTFIWKSWTSHWGTPLVTYLPNPPKSRADVHAAVRMVLRPLLKKPVCDYTSTNNNDNASEVQSIKNITVCEEISDMDLTYNLCLEGNKTQTMIDISLLRPGEFNKLELYRSERFRQLYDDSCIIDLPIVYKPEVKEEISLFSCLDALLNEEPLGLDDMWYCSTCKENRQATKKLDLWRLPEVLCIQLKRFSSETSLNKVRSLVNFPIRGLDLSKYIKNEDPSQNHLYDLYAIINHWGSLGGGHYTTYAKVTEGETETWYNFDDSSVNAVEESKITTPEAYILFYKRVSLEKRSTTHATPYRHD